MARKNLLANKLRSGLSVLGLIIGIAAATVVTAISNGLKQAVEESYLSFGVNAMYILPMYSARDGRTGTFDEDGLRRLSELSFVEQAFPHIALRGDAHGTMGELNLLAVGIYPRHLEAHNISLVEGRNFSAREVELRSRVCLLSAEQAAKLYGAYSPVGQTLRFGSDAYEIVGVVDPPKKDALGWVGADLYVPLTTLMRTEDLPSISMVEVWIARDYAADPKEALLAAVAGDPEKASQFRVSEPRTLLEQAQKSSRTLRWSMLALAGISLLVGGIGIMNVMVISISERTQEIGLRKALGASARDIMLQFIVEVCVLSAVGGVGGVTLGVVAAYFLPQLNADLPTAIVPSAVCFALVFSVLVGVIFGLQPAVKASHLSPLEALRS